MTPEQWPWLSLARTRGGICSFLELPFVPAVAQGGELSAHLGLAGALLVVVDLGESWDPAGNLSIQPFLELLSVPRLGCGAPCAGGSGVSVGC